MGRVLALAHFVFAFALLAASAGFIVSTLRVLPYMSSGTPLTNLPTVLFVAASISAAPTLLGVWLAVLGRSLWQRAPGARTTLLWTHVVLLVAGLAACALGILDLQAAARSAEHGGGLLGALGLVPLLIGAPLVALALCSIAVNRSL
jgi:hypothetical protein